MKAASASPRCDKWDGRQCRHDERPRGERAKKWVNGRVRRNKERQQGEQEEKKEKKKQEKQDKQEQRANSKDEDEDASPAATLACAAASCRGDPAPQLWSASHRRVHRLQRTHTHTHRSKAETWRAFMSKVGQLNGSGQDNGMRQAGRL